MKILNILFLLFAVLAMHKMLEAQTTYQLRHRVFYFNSGSLMNSTNVSDPSSGNDDQRNASIGQHNVVVHNGVFYHTYCDDRSGDYDIYLRTSEDGLNWTDIAQVNDDSLNNQYNPTIAIYDDGGNTIVVVVWQEVDGVEHKIRSATSSDGGQTFSPSVEIGDFNFVYGTYPNITVSDDGIFYTIIYEVVTSWGSTDGKIYFSKSTDNGLTWSNVVNVWDNGSGYDFPPAIVTHGQNLMIINNRGPFYQQYFAHMFFTTSADNGNTWQSASSVVQYPDSVMGKYPSAVVDTNGTVYALWFRGHWHGNSSRVVFSKSDDWGQSWSGEVQVNDNTVTKNAWSLHWMATSLAISDNGNLYAIWQDERRDLGTNNYDIYLSYSLDGGQTWSSDTLVNNSVNVHQVNPSVSVKSGTIDTVLIVWQEERNPTGIEDGIAFTPTEFELEQNYPNPFNPITTISYQLPALSSVQLEIYNTLGQKVKTLVKAHKPAGSYTVQWNGTDDTGVPVASGVYVYRLQAGPLSQNRKMLLLR